MDRLEKRDDSPRGFWGWLSLFEMEIWAVIVVSVVLGLLYGWFLR